MTHPRRLVAVGGAAILAACFLVLAACSSGWNFPWSAANPGNGSAGGSGIPNPLGGGANAGRALGWLSFTGGLSILAGVFNAVRGRPFLSPVVLGVGLILTNWLILALAPAIFWLAVGITGILAVVIGYRAIKGLGNGERLAKAAIGRVVGGVRRRVRRPGNRTKAKGVK